MDPKHRADINREMKRDDKNRRDRDNKPDKKEVEIATLPHRRRDDLKVTGRTQAARDKASSRQKGR